MKTEKLKSERKYLYKLLDNFNEIDLHAVKKFAEFIKKINGDDKLMQLLLKAPYDDGELNEQTIKDIKKAREDLKKGKTSSLEQVKKELGF